MYLVYILKSDKCTYIGMTNNFQKRWEQHNKYRKGGAKYTSKYLNWTPICIIDGFQTKSEAMQCEWKLKRVKGVSKRMNYISNCLNTMDETTQWTKKSPYIINQDLTIFVIQEYKHLFLIDTKELFWY